METNQLPPYDLNNCPSGCCPIINPEDWDGQELHFMEKLFIKAETRSIFHIPLNMGRVFPKVCDAMQTVGAFQNDNIAVLSYDPSPWRSEHLFSSTAEVPGYETLRLSGDFLTKVFEGPYKNAPRWAEEMQQLVEQRGRQVKKTYFFYTTCPKCAKAYGKNYVVAISQFA